MTVKSTSKPVKTPKTKVAEAVHEHVGKTVDPLLAASVSTASSSDKPGHYKRLICAFLSTMLVAAGIGAAFGWIIDMLMVAVAVLTGSMFATLAVYYIGLVLMLVAASVAGVWTWDMIMSGRAGEACATGWSKIKGWVTPSLESKREAYLNAMREARA